VAGSDVNGDHRVDLLVGAPNAGDAGENRGASYVVLSPVSGTISLPDADGVISGANPQDYAGYVGAAGDANDDGYDDIYVGNPSSLTLPTGAWIFFGGPE
jgi:hypothetical protein